MTRHPAALALAVLLASVAGSAQAAAGKVLFVSGPVSVERPASAPLRQGDPVEVGDVIVTGEKARAQILMNDGARVALRASSRYRVDAFNLPAAVNAPTQATAATAEGVSVATLLKGGFRSSTGAIGKGGKGTYEVRAPIGTLGIRGTDYTMVWCQGDCADIAAGAGAQNGLYLSVSDGAIVFRYGGREAVVETGQSIFIAAGDSPPDPLERVPPWLLEDGAGPLTTGKQEGQGETAGLADLSGRREPPAGGQTPPGSAPPDPADPNGQNVKRPVTGTVGGQQTIDLTPGTLPRGPNDPPLPGVPQESIKSPPAGSAPPPNAPPPPPGQPGG